MAFADAPARFPESEVEIKTSPCLALSILLLSAGSASAGGHKLELAAGYLEIVDIRYGYESEYIGAAVSPGLGALLLEEVYPQAGIPFQWSPTLSLYKSFPLNAWLSVNPALVAGYQMGELISDDWEGPGRASSRNDKIYLEERLSLEASYRKTYLEMGAGILPYYEFKAVHRNLRGFDREKHDKWRWDGVGFSVGLGRRF